MSVFFLLYFYKILLRLAQSLYALYYERNTLSKTYDLLITLVSY